jgi:hypothetical protein
MLVRQMSVRRWISLLTCFVPLLLMTVPAAGAQITVGPLLELPGSDTMTVVWETDTPAGGSVIIRDPSGTEREIPSPRPGAHHVATIGGLKPDTRYEYMVLSSGNVVYSSYFFTLPEQGPYRAVFIGDIRENRGVIKDLLPQIDASNPRFIVLLGDLATRANQVDSWEEELFNPGRNVFDHIPILAITGNHEFREDPASTMFRRFFPLPPDTPPGTLTYDLRLCKDYYILLDYYNNRPLLTITDGFRLYRLLRDASKGPDNGNVFVLTHEGVIGYFKFRRGNLALKPLLRVMGNYGVTAIISGHEHCYARGTTYSGVPFFITGGGGSSFQPINRYNFYGVLVGKTDVLKSAYHFLVMDVKGRTCTFNAVSPDGTIFDRIDITTENKSKDPLRLHIGARHETSIRRR